ncbi:uncharacterized protein LOC122263243 [Penaeus japonicus]|uniref:uncharacterized protein LOC122263243 n=1 Tax=Penaeus japonicus TaxID=27405 RepID=UPI001C710766|nr:uncharacterized protein LOC122263243 [Penaeus japonicus]XP_042887564.1 uncharacterized protein LOC122263243 [Penaeus japonicus]XP_042887565.1 uncharacterized protein LOC122263243 [Penaeus japonicus]XP_042887567.1 uncharacterized protein LOC122263243 [Penaeus japonicus]
MDESEAIEVLASFQNASYHKRRMEKFRAAAKLIYGQEWDVELDSRQRIQFFCNVCHKTMNHVKSMSDHSQSGSHLKNIHEWIETTNRSPVSTRQYLSLSHMVESTFAKPIGLQLVEEFYLPGKLYYKCILCGNHGQMQAMYNHLISTEHTDKYINMRVDRGTHFLSWKEREELCHLIMNQEGTRINDIQQIRGDAYFPYRWVLDNGPRK